MILSSKYNWTGHNKEREKNRHTIQKTRHRHRLGRQLSVADLSFHRNNILARHALAIAHPHHPSLAPNERRSPNHGSSKQPIPIRSKKCSTMGKQMIPKLPWLVENPGRPCKGETPPAHRVQSFRCTVAAATNMDRASYHGYGAGVTRTTPPWRRTAPANCH